MGKSWKSHGIILADFCGNPVLTDATDRTTIFDANFSVAFDFRGFFSGTSPLCLKIDGTAIDVKTRLRCRAYSKA